MENKREAFRKYLDDGGVIDSLTRVLVSLYEEPENPQDPLEYVKKSLGSPQGVDIDALKKENEQLKNQIMEIEAKIADLKAKLG